MIGRRSMGLAVFVVIGVGLVTAGGLPAVEAVARLLFGWGFYLARVVPRTTVSRDGVITGLACLVVFAVGLHLFLRWLHGEVGRARGLTGRRWRTRWTASIVAVVILMFAAGIGATGLAHQVGWLASSRRPHVVPRTAYNPFLSEFHLKEIGLALQNYESSFNTLPGRSVDASGRRLQSWQEGLVGFLPVMMSGPVRDDLPWNDPRNSAYFRGIVPEYLNPEIGALRSPEGYSVSHHAGNVHVFGAGERPKTGEAMALSSNTIAVGEVATNFKPWGDPTNLRDPELGISRSPDGFGGPRPDGGTYILFLDGSVRFLGANTDPKILRSMSRPTWQPRPPDSPVPTPSKGQEP